MANTPFWAARLLKEGNLNNGLILQYPVVSNLIAALNNGRSPLFSALRVDISARPTLKPLGSQVNVCLFLIEQREDIHYE